MFTHLVGDVKKTKAKVVTRKIAGKKTLGVVTKDAPKGGVLPQRVYRIEVRHRNAVEQQRTHHYGQEVLEFDEIDTCAMEVCADADLDVTGASTIAEATQRIAPDKIQKSKEEKDVNADSDDDKSTTSGSSDSSDSEDSNSEVNKRPQTLRHQMVRQMVQMALARILMMRLALLFCLLN